MSLVRGRLSVDAILPRNFAPVDSRSVASAKIGRCVYIADDGRVVNRHAVTKLGMIEPELPKTCGAFGIHQQGGDMGRNDDRMPSAAVVFRNDGVVGVLQLTVRQDIECRRSDFRMIAGLQDDGRFRVDT